MACAGVVGIFFWGLFGGFASGLLSGAISLLLQRNGGDGLDFMFIGGMVGAALGVRLMHHWYP